MKNYIILLAITFFFFSCNRQQLPQKTAEELNAVPVKVKSETEKQGEEPILEVEEKLVQVEEQAPTELDYFVIIGSFRNKDNALNYQEEIAKKGFTSELLKNDAGFYRVSVKATDDIAEARTEIRKIRMGYPEHNDTWLLIRKQ